MGEFAEGVEGEGVVDGVGHFAGGGAQRCDKVAMPPDFVGAGALFIDETHAGIDMGDLGDPGFPNEWGKLDLEPEHLTGKDWVGLVSIWAAHGHVWGGELREVGGIGKERPSGAGRNGQSLRLVEGMEFHEEKNASQALRDTLSVDGGSYRCKAGAMRRVWGRPLVSQPPGSCNRPNSWDGGRLSRKPFDTGKIKRKACD